jgi:hypothetical protein
MFVGLRNQNIETRNNCLHCTSTFNYLEKKKRETKKKGKTNKEHIEYLNLSLTISLIKGYRISIFNIGVVLNQMLKPRIYMCDTDY